MSISTSTPTSSSTSTSTLRHTTPPARCSLTLELALPHKRLRVCLFWRQKNQKQKKRNAASHLLSTSYLWLLNIRLQSHGWDTSSVIGYELRCILLSCFLTLAEVSKPTIQFVQLRVFNLHRWFPPHLHFSTEQYCALRIYFSRSWFFDFSATAESERGVQIVAHSHQDFFWLITKHIPSSQDTRITYTSQPWGAGYAIVHSLSACAWQRKEKGYFFLFLIYLSYPQPLCPCSFVSNLEHHPLQHRSIAVLPLPLFSFTSLVYTHVVYTEQPRGLSFLPSRPLKYPAGLSRSSIVGLTALLLVLPVLSFPRTHLTPFTVALLRCCQSSATHHHPFFYCVLVSYLSPRIACATLCDILHIFYPGSIPQPSRPGHIICLLLPVHADSPSYIPPISLVSFVDEHITHDIEIP